MDYSVTFARHFSRLVWLLLHETGNVDEQKAALRAVVTVSKDGPVVLATEDWRLVVNGSALPEALTGVQDLAAQLMGHAVRELHADQGALPADLLGIARILASEPLPGANGSAVERKLDGLGAKTVRVRVNGGADAEAAQKVAAPAPQMPAPQPAPAAPERGPNGAKNAKGAGATKTASAAKGGKAARSSGGISIPEFPDEAAAGAGGSAPPRTSGSMTGVVTGENSGSYLAFAAVQAPKGSARDLLPQLDATKSVNITTRLLDELVTLAENFGREGKSEAVGEIFTGIVRREASTAEADLRRAYAMALRRMCKPTLLRSVSMLLPRRREQLDDYMMVLARAGEDGADALIEQLTAAQSLSERRIYFDCLVKLKAGVPALIHMLGDARWYVARNAADLLGEMQAPECEAPLAELLKHDDDRVRRAATTALGKVGTPRALRALHDAMQDTSPQVRMQAAAGLAGRKGGRSAQTLAKALEAEADVEVQLAILSALGRVATPDAVQKLTKAAESEGRLFKKKSVAYRIAAVQALGEARTPAALAALESLRDDKEKEVRDSVFRALLTAAREQGSERQG